MIAIEEQAHGRTADIDRPVTFVNTADDVAALLHQLKIAQADVVGFSNGGTTVLQLAIRHPKLVRRVVSISGSFKRDAHDPQFWEGMKHATLDSMPAELKAAQLKVNPDPAALRRMFERDVWRMLNYTDIPADQIRAIAAPTLVIVGDRDVVRAEHAVELFRTLANGQLAILPNSDHEAIMKRADVLVGVIQPFLETALLSPHR